jgi:hypothetical protein
VYLLSRWSKRAEWKKSKLDCSWALMAATQESVSGVAFLFSTIHTFYFIVNSHLGQSALMAPQGGGRVRAYLVLKKETCKARATSRALSVSQSEAERRRNGMKPSRRPVRWRRSMALTAG